MASGGNGMSNTVIEFYGAVRRDPLTMSQLASAPDLPTFMTMFIQEGSRRGFDLTEEMIEQVVGRIEGRPRAVNDN
jgi:hypothetical protein